MVITQSFAFINLVELGLVSALGRSLAKSHGEKDYIKFKRLIATTFWLIFGISIIVSAIILLINYFMSETFNDYFQVENKDDNRIIIFSFILILFTLPLRIGRGFLEAKLQFFIIDLAIIISRLISLLLLLILTHTNSLEFQYALIISLMTIILPEVICFFIIIQQKAVVFLKPKNVKRYLAVEQLDIGISNFFTSLSATISRQGYVIFFAIAAGNEFTHLMSIPVLMVLTLSPLVGKISAIYLPAISELIGSSNVSKAILELHRGLFISTAITIIIVGSLICLGKNLLYLWLGDSMSEVEIQIIYNGTICLVSLSLISRIFLVFRSFAQACGFHRNVTYVSIFSAIWTLLASISTIYFFELEQDSIWKIFIFIMFMRILIFDILLMTYISIKKCKIVFDLKVLFYIFKIALIGALLFAVAIVFTQLFKLSLFSKLFICMGLCITYSYWLSKSFKLNPKEMW